MEVKQMNKKEIGERIVEIADIDEEEYQLRSGKVEFNKPALYKILHKLENLNTEEKPKIDLG